MIDGARTILVVILSFLRRHKKTIIMLVAAAMILLCGWSFLLTNYIIDPGIDYLNKNIQPLFGMHYEQLYFHIGSDKSKFSIEENIIFSCKTGMLHNELFGINRFDIIVESDHFDTKLSCPAVLELGGDNAYTRKDFIMYCSNREVTEKQLPFAFDVTLKKKENIPHTFSGFLTIRIWGRSADEVLMDPNISVGVWRHTTIFYYANGERLYFSDISIEDAMKRGTVAS